MLIADPLGFIMKLTHARPQLLLELYIYIKYSCQLLCLMMVVPLFAKFICTDLLDGVTYCQNVGQIFM